MATLSSLPWCVFAEPVVGSEARWSARDAGDKQAWAIDERAERDKEQARQSSIIKAVQDGQRKIDSAVTGALLALLLTACSGPSTISPSASSVLPAAIPALPPQAQQQLAQPWCLPSCSSALTNERKTWRQMLI